MKALLTSLLILSAHLVMGQWAYDEARVVSMTGTTVFTGPITLDQSLDGNLVLTMAPGKTLVLKVMNRISDEDGSWFELEGGYMMVTEDRAMCPSYEGHVIILYNKKFGPQ